MLYRKIFNKIKDFYAKNKHSVLMITGARQVGKSFIIEEFGKACYESFARIDFIENPEYVELFDGTRGKDEIMMGLSVIVGEKLLPGKTLIFFDEVQECPNLIVQIKYLVMQGYYDFILSGSLLGTIYKDIKSMPVGYLTILEMFPMDFEEFTYANGVSATVIDSLRASYETRTSVDDFIHKRMLSLFELYMMVGGMPAVVAEYLRSKNLSLVASKQTSIIDLYKKDIAKYDREEKLYLNEIFDLIPSELNAKNKRFVLKDLNENVKFSKYNNSFIWLKNAGVALPAHVAAEPKSPLLLSRSTNLFKLFLNDVGLLASLYGKGIQLQILNHKMDINFGSIYENFVAEELKSHGYELFYYNNKSKGEVDFIVEDGNGGVLPIEIKSGKGYTRHNAMTALLASPEYGIKQGFVFGIGNVETAGNVTYFPIYMLDFLRKENDVHDVIYDIDFTDLNQYAKNKQI